MNNLSLFIKNIFESFPYKFKNNNIFKLEKYENVQKDDINLFTDFMFFLMKFNFLEQRKMKLISFNWKESFYQTPLNISDFNLEDVTIEENNKDLNFIFPEGNIKIMDKNNYCSNILKYIKFQIETFGTGMDCFKKEKILKMDKLFDKIFLKSHWDKFSDYISDILCSETMKTVYKEIYKMTMIITDKIEIKKILNNIRFFNYRTYFISESKNMFLYIYKKIK